MAFKRPKDFANTAIRPAADDYIGIDGATKGTRKLLARQSNYIDAADYGLIADGSAHPLSELYGSLEDAQAVYPFVTSLTQQIDWAACKLASDLAFGADGEENGSNFHLNKRLRLPGGRYWFGDDTWTIRNLGSAVIEGDGELVTTIRGNATLLAFDGIWYTTIRDFSLQCQATDAVAAMELDGNIPGQPYATRGVQGVLLESLLIDGGGSSYALAMNRQGGSSAQGSECVFTKLHLQNASEACYYQNGFNALANQFIGGNVQNYTKHGINVVGGTISVYGTGFQSTRGYEQIENDGWDILIGQAGAYEGCPIIGCRTESLRFLKNDGAVRSPVSACVGNVAVQGWYAETAFGEAAQQGKAIVEDGRLFVATTEGTSGAEEPTWPTDGSEVEDGTVVWQEETFDVVEMVDSAGTIDIDTCHFSAGRIVARTARGARIAATSTDFEMADEDVLGVDCTNGPVIVRLPPPYRRGVRAVVKKLDASANAVTVVGSGVPALAQGGFEHTTGDDTITGGSRGWKEYVYMDGSAANGSRWHIVGQG